MLLLWRYALIARFEHLAVMRPQYIKPRILALNDGDFYLTFTN